MGSDTKSGGVVKKRQEHGSNRGQFQSGGCREKKKVLWEYCGVMQNGRTAPHAPCRGRHVTIFFGVCTSTIQLNMWQLASSSTLRFRPNCKTNQIQITYRQILSSTVMPQIGFSILVILPTYKKTSLFLLFGTAWPNFAYITYSTPLIPGFGSVVYASASIIIVQPWVRTPQPAPSIWKLREIVRLLYSTAIPNYLYYINRNYSL